jgi:hypothetical protein
MEFFIKKNATLPVLKINVIKDGRSDYDRSMRYLEETDIFFSMIDIETGIPKIMTKPAGFVSKLFDDPNTPAEYYIYYQFTSTDSNKFGRFEGQFLIKTDDGNLILPIREKLYVNIQDSFIADNLEYTNCYTSEYPCCITPIFPSNTPTQTPTMTPTMTVTITPTMTVTPSITPSITPTNTQTETPTPTPTPTNTQTETPTPTPTQTGTPTPTVTETPTNTPTETPTPTPTSTEVPIPLGDLVGIIIPDNDLDVEIIGPTPTGTPTPTPTPSITPTPTEVPIPLDDLVGIIIPDNDLDVEIIGPTPGPSGIPRV